MQNLQEGSHDISDEDPDAVSGGCEGSFPSFEYKPYVPDQLPPPTDNRQPPTIDY